MISRNLTLRSMNGVRFAAAVSLGVSLASTPAHSQYIAKHRIGIAARAAPIAVPASRGDTAQRITHPLPIRAFAGGLGWIAGAFIGAYVLYHTQSHDCGCDDPGLQQVVVGGFAGGLLGAALGAAAPDLDSRCSFGTRFGRGFFGSLAGSVVGLLPNSGFILLAVPILSVTGATLAESRC